jgi:hypothetical protein
MTTTRRSDQLHKFAAVLFLLAVAVGQIFLFGIAIWGLLPKPIDWGATWENSERITGTAEHVVTVAALVVGGIWTYYRFIKGRVLISRLELGVSGEIISLDNANYLRISVELKNVGSSKVEIQEGVGLDIFAERPRPIVQADDAQKYKVRSVNWDSLWPFDILQKHAWIEPGESIRDQTLVELLTSDNIAYKIDLVIFATGTKWTATSVVLPNPESERALIKDALPHKEKVHG